MPIKRHFLDWSSPALPAAAEYLISRCGHGQALDLSQVIIVAPGSRAGRRLLEILVQRAAEASLRLTPPEIVTEGRVPELLYTPKRPFADELTQKLAWADALRSMPPEERQPLLPHPPASNDTSRWLELGDLLRRVHLELAADGLDFAHVLARGPKVAGFAEQDRWSVLREVQAAYLRRLDELQLWDVQTARLVAIQQREIATDKDLVVLGAVDLNTTLRQMLDLVADKVTALVHAPQQLADRFDEHGCLVPAAWLKAEIPLKGDQFERADGPADQADAVARWLASLNARYRSDEVVIGVPDESLAPQLLRQLTQCGISGRWAIGQRLAETGPYRLLVALAEYAERRQFADFARLVRHPDVQQWLCEQLQGSTAKGVDWLTVLDEYHETFLPLRLDIERLAREAQDERNKLSRTLLDLATQIDQLLNVPRIDRPAPLAEWIEPLRHALAAIYGGRMIQRDEPADHYLEQSLRAIAGAAGQLRNVPQELQPNVTFSQATRLALAPLAAETLPPLPDPNAVELLGWLELALDDAPALVVTSLNEGIVPQSVTADSFLPNELRRHLELDDNDRRYARDAYALSVLVASREKLRLVVGHRDADGNPLAPSRLLFAADAETVAQRAVKLFGEPPAGASRRLLLAGLPPAPKVSALSPPRPQPLREPEGRISVTQFRSYLACPYRYYLRHVLKLQVLRDTSEELDGGTFGELVHDVLQLFGRAEQVRGLAEADAIFAFLDERLLAIAEARYGLRHGRPAVRMQVEQIRRRLQAFAEIQAQRTADGWRIIHSEDTQKQLAIEFDVDGRSTTLYGRIDRIDWHPQTDTILVLDYKTADAGDSPEKVHRRGDEWFDLQLPLYRHLLGSVPLTGGPSARSKVELAYFNLPKDVTQTSVQQAEWSADDLAQADETARDVIRNIRREIFWPPADPPPAFSDDFAPICQDHRLGSWQEALPGEAL
jgi:RecB family exonuclease